MRKASTWKETAVDRTQCPICLCMRDIKSQPTCDCTVPVGDSRNPSRKADEADRGTYKHNQDWLKKRRIN